MRAGSHHKGQGRLGMTKETKREQERPSERKLVDEGQRREPVRKAPGTSKTGARRAGPQGAGQGTRDGEAPRKKGGGTFGSSRSNTSGGARMLPPEPPGPQTTRQRGQRKTLH